MRTVTQTIATFRRHYPSCDTTTAGELFDRSYKRLLDKAGIRRADVNFASIVDGTREYDWAEADVRAYGVTWYESATSYWPLTPTSEDALTDDDPAWKDTDETGSPESFYIASRVDASSNKTGKLVLGFHPCPDTTTSGGYPKAVAHVEKHAAISGSTEIPFSLLDEMYFVYAMCEFFACEEDIKKASFWRVKRIEEESVQIEHLKKVSENSEETMILPPKGAFSAPIC